MEPVNHKTKHRKWWTKLKDYVTILVLLREGIELLRTLIR
jgi:hypothetical protein